LSLDASSAAGMLAGALTSAPTYAAAAEVAPDATALAVAYALTSPFGLVGIVLLIQLVPRLLKVDLAADAVGDDADALTQGVATRRSSGPSPEVTRAFEVRMTEVAGKTLGELDLTRRTGCVISRLDQSGTIVIPDGDTVLELGDKAMVTGRVDELQGFESLVGPEVDTRAFLSGDLPTRRIQVRHRAVVGKSLAELRILNRFHCVITRIERGTLWIEPDADARLVRGDVIEVVGRRSDLRSLARELGLFEPPVSETDIAVYAGGILLGILIGGIHLDVFGLRLRLGFAGGLLLMGLVLGARPRIGPIRTHVPREARQLVGDLGILLFVGEAGLGAGAGLIGGMESPPWRIFLAGLLVNVLTVGTALLVARAVLRMRPLDAWGSICGGLTSSAALHAVRRAADSNEAATPYAAAYAVASVLATIAGPLVVLWAG
jgi:putative transport protein